MRKLKQVLGLYSLRKNLSEVFLMKIKDAKLRIFRVRRLMKQFIFIALFSTVAAQAAELPIGIVKLIPNGFEVLSYQVGQLTDDSRRDYLIVVHRPTDTAQQASTRPLLIFTQNIDGTFRLAARNDNVVMQADEGGQCDPFTDSGDSGLAIKDRYFTVQNGVACGDHWTDYITFHYDAKEHNWLFHNEIAQSWHLNPNPGGDALLPDPAHVTKADKKHPITFDAWRPTR